MKALRYLSVTILDEKYDGDGPSFLSNELRYIRWENYPKSSFPDTFQPMNLVNMKLSKSLQKELWKGYKHLPRLTVLELYYMKNMLSTPDFYGLPCLQKLTLHKCKELQEIHPSLGCHKSLEYVRVLYCYKLRKFPTIVQMGKLQTLTIQYCNDSLEFPEIKSNMESLVRLSLRDMRIDVLLSSIGERCVNLVSLDLANCSSLKSTEVDFDGLKYLEAFTLNGLTHSKTRDKLFISWLVGKVGCGKDWYRSQPSISLWLTRSLTKLYISDCGLRDGEIPSNIGELYNLQELHLGGMILLS
ncbi:putative leucine-rich repeat domain superfamily [Helianthus annuus]|nr:putative leucine-rich repeat domain superfamily [Helianthus annuus]